MKKLINIIMLCLVFSACGVKGPPLPPLKPPELSEGRKHMVDHKDTDESKKDNTQND